MANLKLTQKNKALIFDCVFSGISSGTLELLVKDDDSGELDFETVNDKDSFEIWADIALMNRKIKDGK